MDIKKNSVYNEFRQILTKYDLLESLYSFFLYFIFCVFGFYFFISIHIFIGQNSYPNWIIKYNSQNKNLSSLYLISLYYLITTMTTVGYGDIVCASSFREMVFQLILLSAGIAVYSWIVSNIGNYVKNENNASIKFDKDEAILEEIRILYPNMPFKLYKKIYHHLGLRRIRQKQCDSNLLINSLPHSLKNQLLMAIYGQTIKNFKIFRGTHNTDFTIRLLTNFIPLFSKKNAFLIHEGHMIDNIIFVKE
jgi:voltage-gated potassium channel